MKLNRKIIGLFFVSLGLLLFFVGSVSGYTDYTVQTVDFKGYEDQVTGVYVSAPYTNYTGYCDVSNLTMSMNGLRTFVVYEVFDNTTHDGYAFGFGRYSWYYFFGVYSVNDGMFTREYLFNSTVGFGSLVHLSKAYFYKYANGSGYFSGKSYSSGMFNVTNYRLFCGGGVDWIENAGAFNPNVTSPYQYDPYCISGTVVHGIGFASFEFPNPTASPNPSGITDEDMSQFLDFAVVAAVLFVPSLICAVILGKWGFFAGLTIGAVSGFVALGATLFPVWIPVAVGLFDLVMLYQSAKGSI